jgi:prepilin signal peptidase PulO-like enzyme (type II secretory pathway)
MSLLLYSAIFILGLAVGSFLNCVIYRLETSECLENGKPKKKTFSFLRGRSYCPNCKHMLSWQDLIPLLSFMTLGGKCRYCKKPISWQYPLVELATGIIFVLLLWKFGFFPEFIYLSLVSCFLIVIFVSDLKTYFIPDGAIYPAIIIALIFNFQFLIFGQFIIFRDSILSGLFAMLFFLFIYLISRGKWMGFGDVKLAALMGLFLGWPNILVAMFLAFFIGAIMGVGLMVLGRKKMSSEVPFGPFLVLGTFLAAFGGQEIISWYLNFLSI